MSAFLVRIELHGATWADYEKLHAQMEGRGFSRKITGDNGRTYQLPTAEYEIYSTAGVEAVRTLAANAAMMTGRTFGVIAAEYWRTAWSGLSVA